MSVVAVDGERDIAAAVRRAWERVLGTGGPAAGLSFELAGGDSLRLLKLAFFLEQELQAELPLDLFSLAMEPGGLAEAVRRHLGGGETRGVPAAGMAHLLPGLSRDEQRLVRFRAACGAAVAMQAVDYGDWHHWTGRGFGAATLVERVAQGIHASQPGGALYLLGYSLGGCVAVAVARRLLAIGRDVALLGILDTDLGAGGLGGARASGHDRAAERARIVLGVRTGRAAEPLAEYAARRLTGPRWAPVLRTLARFPHARLPGELGFYLHERLRARMLAEFAATLREDMYRAIPLAGGKFVDVPVVVFRAGEQARATVADLGWRALFPGASVVPVAGGHNTMFDPPHLDGLVAAVLRAIGEAAWDRDRVDLGHAPVAAAMA